MDDLKAARFGAVLWMCCLQYFIAEAIAILGWPGQYSLLRNYISDLGAVTCSGRAETVLATAKALCSPRHGVMNASFMIQGFLIVFGSILIRRLFPEGKSWTAALWLIGASGIGVFFVGVFPEDQRSSLHFLAAAENLLLCNVGMAAMGATMLRRRSTLWGALTLAAGLIGAIAVVLLGMNRTFGVGAGLVERIAAYPFPLWLAGAGLSLLCLKDWRFEPEISALSSCTIDKPDSPSFMAWRKARKRVTTEAESRNPDRAVRRFAVACLGVGAALVVYFATYHFVAYTGDAYIRSDLVEIAPEVSGPVVSVHVRNNERVGAGAPLLTIDPKPFELTVAAKRDAVASAEAAVALRSEERASQSANIQSAQAAFDLAQAEDGRVSDLAKRGFASQQDLDKAHEGLRDAQSKLAFARARALVGDREIAAANTDVKSAQAELEIAQYNLSRTQLTARDAGYVNNFNIGVGRYASAGAPLVGLVDDSQWRIIANFKEDVAASAQPGTRVWIWLDTKPWRIYAGRVESVARGIARSDAMSALLPYVAPTTDWVRLRRRLPVTIALDPPLPSDALFMGADARVLFWR